MSNIIFYTRRSTAEQENSHSYQIEGLRRAAKGIEVGYYQDTVTGTSFDNRASGLDAAYKFCERNLGKVDVLYIYRWDRLGAT